MAGNVRAAVHRASFECLEDRHLFTAGPTAENVLVLYNAASTDGSQIANYYAQVHPGAHLLAIEGIDPASEDTTADIYLSVIRPQVLAGLTSSIEVIVTTKGLPLRIQVTETPPAAPFPSMPTYTDPTGKVRTIQYWQPFSSLESELTTINTVSTWQMMGDQSYALPGGSFVNNAYYRSTAEFDPAAYGGMYLTSRLDGYTVSDVLAAIDRAQHAYVGPNNSPSGPYYFLIDNDPTRTYAATMANLVSNVLTPAGLPTVYDNTSAFISTAPGPIIAYDSHGVHQSTTPSNYINTGINVTLADGAVFNSWESYNAYSFNLGSYGGTQGQLAQWIGRGGTAAVGNVQEPGASSNKVSNEDLLFRSLLAGRTWAEAAWSSFAQLGYVNTVIGDPLMRWQRLPPPGVSQVVGRQLFYNDSVWDGRNADADEQDDAAIATDKVAYLPGSGSVSFANVSSYSKGINGILVDLAGPHGTITANDFVFKVGNNNSPDLWSAAPAPTLVTVRAGAGVAGSDRIEILWSSSAILGKWLEVQLKGNDSLGGWNLNSRLAATDVFFFGHAAGDSGASNLSGFVVNAADETAVRTNLRGPGNLASVTDPYDFNRDRLVNTTDQTTVRMFATGPGSQLTFLSLSAAGPFAPAVASAGVLAAGAELDRDSSLTALATDQLRSALAAPISSATVPALGLPNTAASGSAASVESLLQPASTAPATLACSPDSVLPQTSFDDFEFEELLENLLAANA